MSYTAISLRKVNLVKKVQCKINVSFNDIKISMKMGRFKNITIKRFMVHHFFSVSAFICCSYSQIYRIITNTDTVLLGFFILSTHYFDIFSQVFY